MSSAPGSDGIPAPLSEQAYDGGMLLRPGLVCDRILDGHHRRMLAALGPFPLPQPHRRLARLQAIDQKMSARSKRARQGKTALGVAVDDAAAKKRKKKTG